MKNLTALALFTTLAACSKPSAVSSPNALSSNAEVSKPNLDEYDLCEIEWTKEKIAAITKLNNFDLPLTVDVADFKTVARQQLADVFGVVPKGQVHYQDMLGTGEAAYFDFARLYYTAPMPEGMTFNPDISMAYAVSANGQAVLGFTRVVDDRLQFAKPGMLIGYRKTTEDMEPGTVGVTKDEFLTRMAEMQKTIAPDLIWNDGEPIKASLILYAPVKLPENPSPAQISQFVKLWKAVEADPAHEYIEYDGEAIIGTPTSDDMIAIKDSEKTVDMNKLRSVSLRKVSEGGMFMTLPSLPKPFGEGCTILNPKLDEVAPEREGE